MPHLTIEHSARLGTEIDLADACARLSDVLRDTGVFPLGGIRVRTIATTAESVADGHTDNRFAAMVLRIGAGRSDAAKSQVGEAIMAEAEAIFAAPLAAGHFALSLDIVENDPAVSWKTNSIHTRIAGS